MTFRRHILVLFVALLGLLSPSLAAGASAVATSAAPAVTAVADDAPQVPMYHPCKKQGGKRVLPCHPDLGVLIRESASLEWVPAQRLAMRADPVLRMPVPAADPPPPRRG